MAVDREQQAHEHGNDDEGDPGTLLELRDDDHDEDDAGHDGADPVDAGAPLPARLPGPTPSADEARLREREREENPDRVQGDELGDAPVEDREDRGRDERQRDDPEREREPLSPVRELTGHEAIVREHRREPREAGEAGIRGEGEDDRRRELHDVVEGSRPDERAGDEAVERLLLGTVRHRPDRLSEEGQPEEDRREERSHDHERDRRVPPLVRLHARHAVRDGFAPGQPDGAGGECPQDEQDGQRLDAFAWERIRGDRGGRNVPGRDAEDAVDDERADREDVEVGRAREDDARLPDAAEVHDHEDADEDETDPHALVVEHGHEARNRRDAGGGRGRDGEDVVDEERGRGDKTGKRSEVVARDDVAPAAVRVRRDDLRLREDDDGEDAHDRDRDRGREDERPDPGEGQDPHRLLCRVSRR